MPKFEYRVSTKAGLLIFHFDTLKEFQDNLAEIDVDSLIKSADAKPGGIILSEPRQPKPGFEDVYRFTSEGFVELFKVPQSKIDTIGLVLFAFDHNLASFNQIARSSGVPDPSVYLSTKQYAKYFTRTKEGYLLNQEGKEWILRDVVPKLRAPTITT